jgi:hypothetical protein
MGIMGGLITLTGWLAIPLIIGAVAIGRTGIANRHINFHF